MLFLKADHLLAQALINQTQGVLRGRVGAAVVNCVYRKEEVLPAQIVVPSGGAEVLLNTLFRMAESLGNAAAKFRSVRNRPQREKWLHGGVDTDVLLHSRCVWQVTLPGLGIRNQG